MRQNHAIALTLLLFSPLSLAAEKYYITPEDSEVTCRLKTLSKLEAKTKIGDFFPEVLKSHMLVEVTIKNHSDQSITLEKENYLKGVEGLLISKDLLLELYKQEKVAELAHLRSDLVGGSILIAIAATIGYLTYNNYDTAREDNAWFGPVISSLASGGMGIFAIASRLIDRRKKGPELQEKHYALVQATQHYLHSRKAIFYHPKLQDYTIPAGHTFTDLLLINITKEGRKVFDKVDPTLAFTITSELEA